MQDYKENKSSKTHTMNSISNVSSKEMKTSNLSSVVYPHAVQFKPGNSIQKIAMSPAQLQTSVKQNNGQVTQRMWIKADNKTYRPSADVVATIKEAIDHMTDSTPTQKFANHGGHNIRLDREDDSRFLEVDGEKYRYYRFQIQPNGQGPGGHLVYATVHCPDPLECPVEGLGMRTLRNGLRSSLVRGVTYNWEPNTPENIENAEKYYKRKHMPYKVKTIPGRSVKKATYHK